MPVILPRPDFTAISGVFPRRERTPADPERPETPGKQPPSSLDPMMLSPSDTEKLLLAVAGMVARERLQRGVLLNHPEAVALISCWAIEGARDGRGVAELMAEGRHVLTREQVMDGIPEMIPDIQVEATFPDGRKLITITEPIS